MKWIFLGVGLPFALLLVTTILSILLCAQNSPLTQFLCIRISKVRFPEQSISWTQIPLKLVWIGSKRPIRYLVSLLASWCERVWRWEFTDIPNFIWCRSVVVLLMQEVKEFHEEFLVMASTKIWLLLKNNNYSMLLNVCDDSVSKWKVIDDLKAATFRLFGLSSFLRCQSTRTIAPTVLVFLSLWRW